MPQLKLARHLLFLIPKPGAQGVENRVVDLAVDIVDVDLLHAFAQPLTLLLEAYDRSIVVVVRDGEILA